MKETKTINLNGLVYNIDCDAYERLDTYLEDVRSRLSADEANDVMEDIEARISELINPQIFMISTQVVTLTMVEGIIERIGAPETFGTENREQKTENRKRGIENRKQGTGNGERRTESGGCLRTFGIFILVMGVMVLCPILLPVFFGLGIAGVALSSVGIAFLPFLFIIGIPLFIIVYCLVYFIKYRKGPKARFWWIVILLWLLSLCVGGWETYSLIHDNKNTIFEVFHNNSDNWSDNWNDNDNYNDNEDEWEAMTISQPE